MSDRRIDDPAAYGEFVTGVVKQFREGLITDAECLWIILDTVPLPTTTKEQRDELYSRVSAQEGNLLG
jgi:hypothetical protein